MENLHIKKSEIKSITEYIIKKKLIFHPIISPTGFPDFTDYYGKKYVLIIDRNILTKLIELCTKGTLKDNTILKIVSSIIFWAEFNGIAITAGLALNEYANIKNNNKEASLENNLFLEIFNAYPVETWLNLATNKIDSISKIQLNNKNKKYIFNTTSQHFKLHYAEMLKLFSLYRSSELRPEEKVIEFLRWVNDNMLFCVYTMVYAVMLFTNKVSQPKSYEILDLNLTKKRCKNQAWDLTYLSYWSTLYWNENNSDTIHLFATMDTDLKAIFMHSHDISTSLFERFLGKNKGKQVQNIYDEIIANRKKPKITNRKINNIIKIEEDKLKSKFK